MYEPTLIEWNLHVLMLNQSMIGAVSHNFRMVSLKWNNEGWLVEFVFAEKSDEDEEEAFEISDQMSVFLMDVHDQISNEAKTKIRTNIVYSKELLFVKNRDHERVVFKRKSAK